MAKIGINMTLGSIQQEEIVVGIDLGTTNSMIAYVNQETKSSIAINDMEQGAIVPSIIHFDEGANIIVGNEAKEQLISNPARTIYSIKRLLGKSYNDLKQYADSFGYKVIDDEGDGLVKIKAKKE